MTPRLTKEFRALLMPWSLAVLAALLGPLCRLFQRTDSMHGVAGGVATFANFALCAGLGLLAAFSFGAEFQQRTLPLLLAQPVERFRLWREKLVAVVVALATVGLLHAFGWGAACLLRPASAPFEAIRPEEVGSLNSLLLVAMIVLATICSTNFWTLWARS